jgi:hypothetical protein
VLRRQITRPALEPVDRVFLAARSNPGKLQLIVADNGLPIDLRDLATEVTFDYDNPMVPNVPHPGPGVPTIGSEEE